MIDPDAWVPLAEIVRPHGVRGEVRLKLFNVESDALLGRDEVLVRFPDGEEHEVSVEGARRVEGAILMKLYSVDDRDRAGELRGAFVCVRRRDFAPLEEGEYYTVDLLGAEARLDGARIGEIADVLEYPTLEVFLVRADDGLGDWEIPFTEPYVERVDLEARVVHLGTLDDLERLPPKKAKKTRAPKRTRGKEGGS